MVREMLQQYRPAISNERYYTSEQLEEVLHAERRTLQNYRNDRLISYTRLGGKILYLESEIRQLLEENYVPAVKY